MRLAFNAIFSKFCLFFLSLINCAFKKWLKIVSWGWTICITISWSISSSSSSSSSPSSLSKLVQNRSIYIQQLPSRKLQLPVNAEGERRWSRNISQTIASAQNYKTVATSMEHHSFIPVHYACWRNCNFLRTRLNDDNSLLPQVVLVMQKFKRPLEFVQKII